MSTKAIAAALTVAALIGGVCTESWAQAPKQVEAPKAAAGGAPTIAVPDPRQLGILVQTAMVAASQANLTGNYTVLHALAAPSFREANPPEKLAQTFAEWRTKKVDLTPIIIYTPILTQEPGIGDKNLLRLTGYYPTEPLRVHFDLLFQPVGGQWRLFGIAIRALPPQPQQQPQAAGQAKPAPQAAPAEKQGADKKGAPAAQRPAPAQKQ